LPNQERLIDADVSRYLLARIFVPARKAKLLADSTSASMARWSLLALTP
jgi:hypothetical protein